MGYLSTLGSKTKNIVLNSEEDKLSLEFAVAAANTVKIGQPVKLNAAGEVLPWAKADGVHTLIGFAISDAAAAELVTIRTKGFMVVFAISLGALNCVPVTYNSFDSATDIGGTTGYMVVEGLGTGGSDTTQHMGWCLDVAAGANGLVRVLLRN